MARIEASTHIQAPVARVWDVLCDWEAQPVWMRDARSVEVTSPHRTGPEVVLRCRTAIAGILVTDTMVTTEWEEQRIIGVRHTGWPIRGVGAFEVAPTPHGTHFTWWEEITVPLWAVGEAVATLVVVPPVRRVFRRSVAGLKRVCETPPPA